MSRPASPWIAILALYAAGLGAAGQFSKMAVILPQLGQAYPQAGTLLGFLVSLLSLVGVALGLVFRRMRLPAPILLGQMLASTLGHVTGLTPGTLPAWLMIPAFLVMGTLIGTRFSGMKPAQVRAALLAGLAVTLAGAGIAALAALPVALMLGIPQPHVLTGFAPGGLETMLALGAAMGASPGFIAACHIIRLLILSVLIPLALHRAGRQMA